ncbi:unnamed protein product [marine sediment metagenome]|uniref:Uncharacterized protein n=1 Tax=marine sediment metagenome TaxID=412755 RepID=X0TBD9_9ZZZZ
MDRWYYLIYKVIIQVIKNHKKEILDEVIKILEDSRITHNRSYIEEIFSHIVNSKKKGGE